MENGYHPGHNHEIHHPPTFQEDIIENLRVPSPMAEHNLEEVTEAIEKHLCSSAKRDQNE